MTAQKDENNKVTMRAIGGKKLWTTWNEDGYRVVEEYDDNGNVAGMFRYKGHEKVAVEKHGLWVPMDKIPLAELAEKRAHSWHDGVVYGGGLVMTEQVLGTAQNIGEYYNGSNQWETWLAAFLYKAREIKRLNPETKQAMEDDKRDNTGNATNAIFATRRDFSPTVARIVSELSSEPVENSEQTKTQQWEEKTKWAKTLSREAQAILLAEKLQNFVVSRDKPNESKPPAWHIEYYKTRMIMVEAIKGASPALYKECVKVAEEGIKVQQDKLEKDAALKERAEKQM